MVESIIVVADSEHKKMARLLVHSISKSDGAKASLYSPDQFEDNEHQISGKQKVIFLGLNSVSEDFLPLMEIKFNNLGACWGIDSGKALIFADPEKDEEDEDKLEEEIAKLGEKIKKSEPSSKGSSAGAGIAAGAFGVGFAGAFLAPILPVVLGGGALVALAAFVFGDDKVEELQLTLGTASFLSSGIDDFLNKDE